MFDPAGFFGDAKIEVVVLGAFELLAETAEGESEFAADGGEMEGVVGAGE